jgi:hypothetical protein
MPHTPFSGDHSKRSLHVIAVYLRDLMDSTNGALFPIIQI